MNKETLRKGMVSVLRPDPEVIGNRELKIAIACQGPGEKDVTSVAISFQGTPPVYRLIVDNMYYDSTQRVVLLNGEKVPNGRRKELICALVDTYLQANGWHVHSPTRLPLNFKLSE